MLIIFFCPCNNSACIDVLYICTGQPGEVTDSHTDLIWTHLLVYVRGGGYSCHSPWCSKEEGNLTPPLPSLSVFHFLGHFFSVVWQTKCKHPLLKWIPFQITPKPIEGQIGLFLPSFPSPYCERQVFWHATLVLDCSGPIPNVSLRRSVGNYCVYEGTFSIVLKWVG